MSLDLIRRATSNSQARIIDVGGGSSFLAGALLREGFGSISVLDVSPTALAHARDRLGGDARHVTWLETDVLTTTFSRGAFDVWHDRAVWHFLTDAKDRAQYAAQIRTALRAGGAAVLATFAEDGPDKCSDLPVMRYTPEALGRELGALFELLETAREEHVTPSGARQSFVYCLFRFRA